MFSKRYTLLAGLFVFCIWPQSVLALNYQTQTLTVNGHSVQLRVPVNTEVEFLGSMAGPRFLSLGPNNELLVGTNNSRIYRVAPPYTNPQVLANLSGSNHHSVVYRNGTLFTADPGSFKVANYNGLGTNLDAGDFSEFVSLPAATGGHASRTVIVGPDNALYIGLGISGNCSNEYLDNTYPFELRRGGVFKLDEGGASPALVPFSSGLRNPIGLAFDPVLNRLFATNAGSDDLGFELPREIFSILSDGSYHGMPWFQYINGQFERQDCISSPPPPRPANEATPPSVTFDARSTPMAIAFMPNTSLGSEFIGNAMVAIHGSWARPSGGGNASRRPPKLVMVRFAQNQPQSVVDVVTGFQRADGSRFARPVGALVGPDGHLYFTSDRGEVTGLFRLKRVKNTGAVVNLPALVPVLLDQE